MALYAQIIRGGKPISIRWNWNILGSILNATRGEGVDMWKEYEYELKNDYTFIDPSSNDAVVFLKGDVIRMWRDR